MAIEIFQTEAQYEAATLSTTESTVSLITDTNEIKVDGVMVLTSSPKKGDICVVDDANAVRFYTLDSYDNTLLPTGWTVAGFVSKAMGSKVIVSRTLTGYHRIAKYYLWKITGYVADGAAHAFSFTINGYTCSGNYTGNDINEVAASMNAIVKPFAFGTDQYHIYVRNGDLILQHDTYTLYRAVNATGVSVTAATMPFGNFLSAPRKNGNKGSDGAILNSTRALIRYRADLAAANYNPSTDVTNLQRQYPVCLPAYLGTSQYQSDHCAFLRNYYGAGESGWVNFMENGMEMLWPSQQGVCSPYDNGAGNGYRTTYILAGKTCEDHNGNTDYLYTAFDTIAAISFSSPELAAGRWYMPSVGELREIMKDIIYPQKYVIGTGGVDVNPEDADVISRACHKMGIDQVRNTYGYWTSSHYSQARMYNYSNEGALGGSMYYAEFSLIASAVVTLPQAD